MHFIEIIRKDRSVYYNTNSILSFEFSPNGGRGAIGAIHKGEAELKLRFVNDPEAIVSLYGDEAIRVFDGLTKHHEQTGD